MQIGRAGRREWLSRSCLSPEFKDSTAILSRVVSQRGAGLRSSGDILAGDCMPGDLVGDLLDLLEQSEPCNPIALEPGEEGFCGF